MEKDQNLESAHDQLIGPGGHAKSQNELKINLNINYYLAKSSKGCQHLFSHLEHQLQVELAQLEGALQQKPV